MKISNLFIASLLLLVVAACSSEKETPSGMKYTVLQKGDGVLPRPGQISVFDFVFSDSKDSVWRSTYDMKMPSAIMIQDSTAIISEDGLIQMLRMSSKGDSVRVRMQIKEFFKNIVRQPLPAELDSTVDLIYVIKIRDIMNREAYMSFQDSLITKLEADQLKADIATIDEFLASKNISAQKLESGLRYVITAPGTGENAQSGQTVKVDYVGYLLDGKHFDTSKKAVAEANGILNPMREYAPYDVTIDQSMVIKGWHEALKQLNKGAKATVYVPSPLAYGAQRRGDVIKENSILVFDLELVDFVKEDPKKATANGARPGDK